MERSLRSQIEQKIANGDLPGAANTCGEYCRLNSQDHNARFMLGKIHIRMKHYGHAIEDIQAVMANDSNVATVHYHLGKLHKLAGQTFQAEQPFRRVLVRDLGVAYRQMWRRWQAT